MKYWIKRNNEKMMSDELWSLQTWKRKSIFIGWHRGIRTMKDAVKHLLVHPGLTTHIHSAVIFEPFARNINVTFYDDRFITRTWRFVLLRHPITDDWYIKAFLFTTSIFSSNREMYIREIPLWGYPTLFFNSDLYKFTW